MKSIRIAYDAKRAVQNMTGLGNYSRLIIESIGREYPSDRLTLFAPRHRDNPRMAGILALPNVELRFPQKGEAPLGTAFWRTFGLPRLLARGDYEIYHGLSNELPLNISRAGIPSVVTMHDVIYRRMPQCYSPIDRKIYDLKYGRSCRQATRIIAISECTKRDVMEYYGVPEEKIDIVYQGVDEIFKRPFTPAEIEQAIRKHGLQKPYILQVGSIEERKNAMLSVRALTALPADIELVLVGRPTPYLDKVLKKAERLGVRSRVRLLHGVPFPDLPLLYRGAAAAAYPSRYEGFGLPVLEALTCGTPCVAATGSCLEEAGGPGALYVDPDDTPAMAQALNKLLTDSDLRETLRAEGLRHADRFRGADVAANTRTVYLKAIEDFRAKSSAQ
ncbi:MAG: glycosyltransferase family 4 protein [Bacteroidales bacterium]|nr:glycosyltransferase family 4 protein [Bacteroidales bacterium]